MINIFINFVSQTFKLEYKVKQNIFASYNLKAELNTSAIGPRIKYVSFLIDLHSYYPRSEVRSPQTEEGIIGDFQTCVVQILYQDMNRLCMFGNLKVCSFPSFFSYSHL